MGGGNEMPPEHPQVSAALVENLEMMMGGCWGMCAEEEDFLVSFLLHLSYLTGWLLEGWNEAEACISAQFWERGLSSRLF